MITHHRKKQWKDLSSSQRASVAASAALQLTLAAAAWIDLARRPADQLNGKKGIWGPVIAINFIGPILYFVLGRKH